VLPTIITSSALGDDKKDPASERLGIGFIGMGTMNRGHLGHFLGQRTCKSRPSATWTPPARGREENRRRPLRRRDQVRQYKGCQAYTTSMSLSPAGHRRRRHRPRRSLAHDHFPLEAIKAKKGHLSAKAVDVDHSRSQVAHRRDPQARAGLPGRQASSAPKAAFPACELVRSGRLGKLKVVNVDVGAPSKPSICPKRREEPWPRLDAGSARRRNGLTTRSSVRAAFTAISPTAQHREYLRRHDDRTGARIISTSRSGASAWTRAARSRSSRPTIPRAQKGVKYIYANGVPVIHTSWWRRAIHRRVGPRSPSIAAASRASRKASSRSRSPTRT